MKIFIGPAGNSQNFKDNKYKSKDLGKFLNGYGLNAYEYQCGQGVRITEKSAEEIKSSCDEYNIKISLHTPYFISLSSVEEDKRLNSINYILESAKAVKMLGGERIIVHSGSCAKISRIDALELAKDTLFLARKALIENNLNDVIICPETMGKINQLGTLQEVMELCKVDESFIPCIDFGHLNARGLGSIKNISDYENILNTIENDLGSDRLKIFHSHFSKIEYTSGGEKKHLTFEDESFGPNFEPLAELILKKQLYPTLICESDGTQDIDANTFSKWLNI